MENMKRLILSILVVIMVCCSIGCAEKASMTTYNQQSNTKVINDDAPQELIITVGDVSFTMKKVVGGTFLMGATPEQGRDEKNPPHNVKVDSYYIGETEVTQALWIAVIGYNPSRWKGNDLPVEEVSWFDCQPFIRKLNQMTGKNFRLPTEAEWEYAARGGRESLGYRYAGSNYIETIAWYHNNSGIKTHPVKGKLPNELGLYDMSGNVYEWCQDKYDAGPGYVGEPERILRGGSWQNAENGCLVSKRAHSLPGYGNIGFRLALDL